MYSPVLDPEECDVAVSEQIPLSKPALGDEEVEAVRDVLASGWIAGQGPRGHALEERFAEVTDRTHAVAVSNCTAALHLSSLAFGVGAGDEVIVADYTYPATGTPSCSPVLARCSSTFGARPARSM